MGMFGMFGKKEGGYDDAHGEWGGDNVGMMKMLSGMSHMMRKPMMKGRINQLLSLTEEKRQESIRDMIGAFHSNKVKASARENLVAIRVGIVGYLSPEKRCTIIASRSEALKVAPELGQQDREVQKKVLPKISKSSWDAFQPLGMMSTAEKRANSATREGSLVGPRPHVVFPWS